MASLCKKRGASGALSPYWQAILSFNHRKIWISTKCTDRRIAKSVSERWTRACWLAGRWELNQQRCDRLLSEIQAVTKCPATLDHSRELFRRLMAETTGELYAGENLTDYIMEWIAARRKVTAGSTIGKYERILGAFLESLPERRRTASVGSISAAEIRKYRDGLLESGLAESSANVELASLRALFNDARRQGVVVVNPAEAVGKLQAHDVDARVPFTTEQIRALLKAANSEWQGMILLGCHAGLRIGDAAHLRWSNIDLLNRVLTFEAQKTSRRKKRNDRKTHIYMHDDLLDYWDRVASSDDPNAPLFPSLYDTETSGTLGLSMQFSRVMEKAGIVSPTGAAKVGKGRVFKALSFHSLRHSFCSLLANSEVPAEVRKMMSGHSSDQIHQGYSHLSVDLQKSAIGKLASVLS
jgi:integrase